MSPAACGLFPADHPRQAFPIRAWPYVPPAPARRRGAREPVQRREDMLRETSWGIDKCKFVIGNCCKASPQTITNHKSQIASLSFPAHAFLRVLYDDSSGGELR